MSVYAVLDTNVLVSSLLTHDSQSPTGELLPDMDDLVFYEVVMEKRDDGAYLVTGNIRHFPQRNFIVTPAEMMKILHENK